MTILYYRVVSAQRENDAHILDGTLMAMGLGVDVLAQPGGRPAVEHLAFDVEGHGEMTYAVSVPAGYDAAEPRPLILALHPGGLVGGLLRQRQHAADLRAGAPGLAGDRRGARRSDASVDQRDI